MPTAAGSRLTVLHRQAQVRLGAQTAARMAVVWPLLDPADVDGTVERWLAAAKPIVSSQRAMSSRLASNYLTAFRTLEIGAGFVPILAETADPAAVQTSLLVTGPVSIKRAMLRGVQVERAAQTARAASASSAMRHALDGGRQTIIRTLAADNAATGWQRVASGNACKFCTILDGKFHYASTADFEAHDGCSCTQEPVYDGVRRISERSLAAR